MVQGELFQEENGDIKGQNSPSFFANCQFVLGLDKIILLTIAFVVLFVLIYSFGFERGQKATERKIQALTAHIETVTSPATEEKQESTSVQTTANEGAESGNESASKTSQTQSEEKANVAIEEKAPASSGKYTIQIATAVSKESAEKEIGKLAKNGLNAFVIHRGRYYEICTGSFGTVSSAKSLLSEFKSKGPYFDAFVRPNSSV